eukprot:scaffold207546_cov30-Tisochrysis_lutea.AAC.3
MPSVTPSTRLARLARLASFAASSSFARPPKPGRGGTPAPIDSDIAPGGGLGPVLGVAGPPRGVSGPPRGVSGPPAALRLLISSSRCLAAAAIRCFFASRSSHSTLYKCAFSRAIANVCRAENMRSGSALPPFTSSASHAARLVHASSAAVCALLNSSAAAEARSWKAPSDSLKAGIVSVSTSPETCTVESNNETRERTRP